MVSPLLGTAVPNGELLAAPFVAGGFWAAVAAVSTAPGRSAHPRRRGSHRWLCRGGCRW